MTGLIVAVIVVGAGLALWGVVEWDGRNDPRHDTVTFPPIVPGQGTPARPAVPRAAATAIPPAVLTGGAETPTLAGGSSSSGSLSVRKVPGAPARDVPAGTPQGPGPGSLPEGNAAGRSPQEAPAPGALPLFPDWPTGEFAAVIEALGTADILRHGGS